MARLVPAMHALQYGDRNKVWVERHRQLWDERFDVVDKVVEALKQKEKVNGRK